MNRPTDPASEGVVLISEQEKAGMPMPPPVIEVNVPVSEMYKYEPFLKLPKPKKKKPAKPPTKAE